MLRLLTVVGARPQFIKAAAISHTIRDKYRGCVAEDLLHTGQHYDDAMSARFFDELDIPAPRYNLGVGSSTHGAQTAAMLKGIEEVLLAERYDAVLVYGDTNSTLAGALAAAKLAVPVVHVEAGLRSHNDAMPEELNRVLTDHASTLLFAPTMSAVRNLESEGISSKRVVMSGDVMLDNVRHYATCALTHNVVGNEVVLLTIHRNFNADSPQRLKNILDGVDAAACAKDAMVLFPVHPRTRQRLGAVVYDHIRMVEPLSYLQTLAALQSVRLVMTDSGGLQKEAFFCGKPCVVLRPETEWTEIVECGAARLTAPSSEAVAKAAIEMWDKVPVPPTQFGNGHAADTMVASMLNQLSGA